MITLRHITLSRTPLDEHSRHYRVQFVTNPGGGTRFLTLAQTGPGAYPASYAMGTGSLSRGVQRKGRGVNHPTPSSAEVKDRLKPYHSLFSGEIHLTAAFNLRFIQRHSIILTMFS
jgi:hypothetical protein